MMMTFTAASTWTKPMALEVQGSRKIGLLHAADRSHQHIWQLGGQQLINQSIYPSPHCHLKALA